MRQSTGRRVVTLEKGISRYNNGARYIKKSSDHFRKDRETRYKFMKDHCGEFPVKKMAICLNVSSSRYYKWINGKASNKKENNTRLQELIQNIFAIKKGGFGSSKIHKDLKESGHNCGGHKQ